MDAVSVALLILTIIIFVVGFAGILLPAIPSLPLIWIGILIYGFFTHFVEVTIGIIIITGIIMLIGVALDFVAGIFGAKIYGASWAGVIGALFGGLVGMILFNVVGLLIGSFFGAFIGEYIRYKKMHPAMKAGFGTIVGFIIGVVVKIVLSFLMIGIFIVALF